MTLNKLAMQLMPLTGGQAKIVIDEKHNNATIEDIDNQGIRTLLDREQIVIVAGFQGLIVTGISQPWEGGSDTTAVTLAGYLGARECQILLMLMVAIWLVTPKLFTRLKNYHLIFIMEEMVWELPVALAFRQVRTEA